MVDTVFQDKEETMGYKHKDALLESLIDKRVTINFKHGKTYTGTLGFNEELGMYILINVVDEKTGFPTGSVLFRKSHYKDVVRR